MSKVAALCAGDEAFVKSVLYPPQDITSLTQGLLDADSTPTPADIMNRVQKRVSDLEREVYLLKSHRNAVASNIPLPAELLAKVFCILEQSSRGTSWKALEWVRVTHVCRHWRTVALECPALWGYITTQYKKRKSMDILLERSKQAPLTVYFRDWKEEDDPMLLDIVSQTQRLQSLELERDAGHKSSPMEKVLFRFSGSPKLLEKLVIVGHKGRERTAYNAAPDNTTDAVPKELAQVDFPCLRTLEISHCLIPWEVLPKAPRLIHLKLHTLSRTSCMPAQPFLSSLRSLPLLQSLDLVDLLPGEDLPAAVPPIPLPALRNLKLRGSFAQLLCFLRATRIPEEATLHLGFTVDPEAEEAAQFLSALETSWVLIPQDAKKVPKPTFTSKFQTFAIANVGRDYDSYGEEVKPPTLHWWFGPALPAKSKALPKIENARLSISFAEQGRSSCQALQTFLDQLDFSSLRCLQLDTCPEFDSRMWDVYTRLEKLVTINFRNGKTIQTFAAKIKDDPVDGSETEDELSGSGSDSDSDGYSSYNKKNEPKKKEKKVIRKPYFPALTYVRCHKVHFGDMDDWGGTAITIGHLVDGFEKRPEPKYSHLSMQVVDCINFSHEDITFMAENTDVDVAFDGKQCWDEQYRRIQRRTRGDFW